MRRLFVFRLAALFASLCCVVSAIAQDRERGETQPRQLTVMTSGTFATALAVLGPEFERETGIRLTIVRGASVGDSPTSIPSRLMANEYVDVIILSKESLERLTDRGEVRPGTGVDLVRSRIAMAVQSGAEKPDISTVDAFVGAVRRAESFAYSASVSGTYLSTEVFPELGIWEEIESKGVRVNGEPVAALVARGEVEIGFQQVSEILAVDGVELVGPLPADIQLVSTFSAAVTARSLNSASAEALIEFLSSPAAAETIISMGLDPVVLERN